MVTHTFKSPEALQDWGKKLARLLRADDVIALVGPLGAGKTTLVQGIAAGKGYDRRANSPTFALVNEYTAPDGRVLHMDLYRLSEKELDGFPFEEYLQERALCLIEWADRLRPRWPRQTLELRLSAPSETSRQIEIIKPNSEWQKRLKAL